ncbi:MAG: hypothetical protein ACI9XB_004756 [Gammaproteobacteria bacterium]|jgi:hypothetical protein
MIKAIALISMLFIGSILFSSSFTTAPSEISRTKQLPTNDILCSSYSTIGKCTGSAYCTACKNCKYCKLCNNGGSCGVCSNKTSTYHRTKPKKQNKSNSSQRSKQDYTQSNRTTKSRIKVEGSNFYYIVTKATSLRVSGDSKSKILKRLQIGTGVSVLDSSGKYWWKVTYNNKVGWVKKQLLKIEPPAA